jgi:hypothetical protein
MIELVAHNLAPIMFVSVMAMLLLGYPVAFTLAAGGLLFFAIGVEFAYLDPSEITLSWPLLQANPARVFGVMSNDTLLAVPFFTFMGSFSKGREWPRNCSTPSASSSGPCAAGSLTRPCWSAPCSPQPPA